MTPSLFSRFIPVACVFSLLATVALPAHAEEKTEEKPVAEVSESKPADYVILEVDGEKIKYSEVVKIWAAMFPQGTAPDFSRFDEKVRQNVLRGVISEKLIHKEVKASGIENSAEAKEMLEKLKTKLVAQMFLEKKAGEKVTDATVRAEYDKRAKEKKGKKEIHARHILLKTEEEAKAIKEQLEDGANFEKLAREKSGDTASGKRGGDLGYFGEGEMIPEFTKAAFAMDKGEISDPVKTEFGWHIIKLEDKRDAQIVPFEEMDNVLREELKTNALKAYLNELIDTAKVSYFAPDGKKLELTRTPDTATEGQ